MDEISQQAAQIIQYAIYHARTVDEEIEFNQLGEDRQDQLESFSEDDEEDPTPEDEKEELKHGEEEEKKFSQERSPPHIHRLILEQLRDLELTTIQKIIRLFYGIEILKMSYGDLYGKDFLIAWLESEIKRDVKNKKITKNIFKKKILQEGWIEGNETLRNSIENITSSLPLSNWEEIVTSLREIFPLSLMSGYIAFAIFIVNIILTESESWEKKLALVVGAFFIPMIFLFFYRAINRLCRNIT